MSADKPLPPGYEYAGELFPKADAYALGRGHPPSAAGVVLVDFDKTIRPWGHLNEVMDPLPGAAEAIRRLAAAGYSVVILTSRMSPTWWRDEGDRRQVNWFRFGLEQAKYVREYLERYGIPYGRITSEKVPALALFDDTAVRVSEEYPLSRAVDDFISERAS